MLDNFNSAPTKCQVCAILSEVCTENQLRPYKLLVAVGGQRQGRKAELVAARREAIHRLYEYKRLRACPNHGLALDFPPPGNRRWPDGTVEIITSLPNIGRILGYKDHTTVLYHLRHQEYISRDG